MHHLSYQIERNVATVVLNNPPQNHIGDKMIDELAAAIDAIGRRDARAVLTRGEGENFSSTIPMPLRHSDSAAKNG